MFSELIALVNIINRKRGEKHSLYHAYIEDNISLYSLFLKSFTM